MKTTMLRLKIIILIMSLLLINNAIGFAQTTKTTKSDGLWSDPKTWTGEVIPDASNKATINNDVIIDMDVNILSLTISASSSLTFDTLTAHIFTVADEIVVNGLFTVARNKVSPLKHIVEVGADFYGPGTIDFYDRDGDVVDLVFIGNSNSTLRDIADVTGTGGNGKFGGLKVEKTIKSAVVTLKKSLDINSGPSLSLQSNVTVVKGILDFDSSYVSAGDNTNKLQVDSLGQVYIASLNTHSGDGFEEYAFHPGSTVKYYNGDNYEMTKGWDAFNGEFGNFIVSGNGIKYFGDSVVTLNIKGNFTIDAGADFNLDNDSLKVNRPAFINGTFSSNNKPGYIIFDSLVTVSDNGGWQADMNDIFEFRNGLNVSKKADFSSGTSNYIFTTNNQEIFLQDTIQNIEIQAISLINTDSLACNTLTGNGTLVNSYTLDFLGTSILCDLNLDSTNNMVIYSNHNPMIKSSIYENIRYTGEGTGSLEGAVIVKKSLIKDNDGYISLENFDLTFDTLALFQLDDPDSSRMIVTNGTGSLIIKSNTADRFTMVFPVGTLTDSTVYTPFEITNTINHPGGEKYISVRTTSGLHPGMEDATGLEKYWTIGTNMLPTDSIEADIKFTYSENEVGGDENNYEVSCWTGSKPWVEPDHWSINSLTNEISVTGVNDLSMDWTAGDSASITSKVDNLTYSSEGGTYYNLLLVTISSLTPDINIYYTLDGSTPDNTSSAYTTAITIDSALTLKAIGYKEGWQTSDVSTDSYDFKVDTVKFSLAPGTYTGNQQIELSTITMDAEIYYTTDGTDPDMSSNLYNDAIEIDTAITIKAIGYKDKYQTSVITDASYIIETGSGIAPSFDISEILIYPIPAKEILTIDLENIASKDVIVSLFSPVGELVYTHIFNSAQIINIDISKFSAGCFYLSISYANTITTKKIIKY